MTARTSVSTPAGTAQAGGRTEFAVLRREQDVHGVVARVDVRDLAQRLAHDVVCGRDARPDEDAVVHALVRRLVELDEARVQPHDAREELVQALQQN